MYVDDFSDVDTDEETLNPSDNENPYLVREYKLMLNNDTDSNFPSDWPRSPRNSQRAGRRDAELLELPDLVDDPEERQHFVDESGDLQEILRDRESLSMSDLHISGPRLRPPIPPLLLRNDSDEDEQ